MPDSLTLEVPNARGLSVAPIAQAAIRELAMDLHSGWPSERADLAAGEVASVHASRHAAPWHYPLHWLPGDLCDEVIVAVVMQERDLLPFRDSGD